MLLFIKSIQEVRTRGGGIKTHFSRGMAQPRPRPNPCFFGKKRKDALKKARIPLSAEPLKALEKKGKTHKKAMTTAKKAEPKKAWIGVVRGLGTSPPDPTLESASPSPPQGSIRHRNRVKSGNRCRIDAESMPNRPLRRGGRGRFEGGVWSACR